MSSCWPPHRNIVIFTVSVIIIFTTFPIFSTFRIRSDNWERRKGNLEIMIWIRKTEVELKLNWDSGLGIHSSV